VNNPLIHTIDLNFRNKRGTIAVYLVPHTDGCILIESGPGSAINTLIAGLIDLGYKIEDVTDVFLTHIHLDHAGAAGLWAKNGAQIHVHENGAPHLLNPERLLASANRLYGDMMDSLWGEFLPVQERRMSIVQDQEVVQISDLSIRGIDAPGHASHHLVYLIGDACFCGDIGGIRLNPHHFLSLPMPPPDFHLEKWRASILLLQQYKPKRIVPTHFGVYPDAEWHLQAILDLLDEIEAWIDAKLPSYPSVDDLRQQFIEFELLRAEKYHIKNGIAEAQQIANPSFMSADGILRYWNKYRKQE